MWREGNPFAVWVGMQTGATTVQVTMEIPQNIKNGPSFGPSYPTSGTQNSDLRESMHPIVHFNVLYNHQDMEGAQVSINR